MIEIKRWWDHDFFLDMTDLLKTSTMSLQGTLPSSRQEQEHVSQADGWMYTHKVSLELFTDKKIAAAPTPCKLVVTNWAGER